MNIEIEKVFVENKAMWLAREYGTGDIYEAGDKVGEAVEKVLRKIGKVWEIRKGRCQNEVLD